MQVERSGRTALQRWVGGSNPSPPTRFTLAPHRSPTRALLNPGARGPATLLRVRPPVLTTSEHPDLHKQAFGKMANSHHGSEASDEGRPPQQPTRRRRTRLD